MSSSTTSSSRRRSSANTLDDDPSRNRSLVKQFLSCQHLLSNEEILEFLSGEEQESGDGDINNIQANGHDHNEGFNNDGTWKRHNDYSCHEQSLLRQAFHRRRAEIRKLTANLNDGLGGARIDEDGRLVRATEPPQPPRANLPPVAGDGGDGDGDGVGVGVGNNIGNNPNNNDNPQLFPANNNNHQQENQEELFLEQKRLETEFTIAQAINELRSSTNNKHQQQHQQTPVPEEDFEVILLDPIGRPVRAEVATRLAGRLFRAAAQNNNIDGNDDDDDDNHNLLTNGTVRRIAIASFISVVVVLCTILQILPIASILTGAQELSSANRAFDALLNEVLVVRGWKDHVGECAGGLANRSEHRHFNDDDTWEWLRRTQESLFYGKTITDCSEGVLHIPSKRVIRSDLDLRDYKSMRGMNVSWFMPCSGHPSERFQQQQQCNLQETNDDKNHPSLVTDNFQSEHSTTFCREQRVFDQCFRGTHDNFIEKKEINAAISMGDALIQIGGDHFDVHYDVSILNRMVPSIVEKVKNLLDRTYLNQQHQQPQNDARSNNDGANTNDEELKNESASWSKNSRDIQHVAFRVLTTGPMDGHDVKLKQKGEKMSMYLTHSSALNETNYLNWVLKSRQHNDKARYNSYYRPWPYRLSPKRETCDLKFDLEADARFCIQSSLSLTSGAGEDYWGGTNLFVDNHPSNFANPRRRIARGVSIDGSRGRLVVSTGGFENLKCRFPTRAGFRTELQIWWDC